MPPAESERVSGPSWPEYARCDLIEPADHASAAGGSDTRAAAIADNGLAVTAWIGHAASVVRPLLGAS